VGWRIVVPGLVGLVLAPGVSVLALHAIGTAAGPAPPQPLRVGRSGAVQRGRGRGLGGAGVGRGRGWGKGGGGAGRGGGPAQSALRDSAGLVHSDCLSDRVPIHAQP
jgi:hypothetical protein